jgi:hypothetical protein
LRRVFRKTGVKVSLPNPPGGFIQFRWVLN